MTQLRSLVLFGTALTLVACASVDTALDGDKVDYKSAAKVKTLDIPPDLTQLNKDPRYQAPVGGKASASAFQGTGKSAAAGSAVAASSLGDVRLERAGSQRWLVVQRPAEDLFEPIREFWLESGFLLTTERADLGIIETDWAENRAKIPQDFIRNALGKILDSLYSTAERDRFRVRLEQAAGSSGKATEIYLSHRGMIEVYDNNSKGSTVWQSRPADPELEAEFLRRLMLKLGAKEPQVKAALAQPKSELKARLSPQSGLTAAEVLEPFDRAWRRVGLSLDRAGFTVEDRDRAKGLFFVRYIDPEQKTKEGDQSFFNKLFSGKNKPNAPIKLRIQLLAQDGITQVRVQNETGTPLQDEMAQRILKLLVDDLK